MDTGVEIFSPILLLWGIVAFFLGMWRARRKAWKRNNPEQYAAQRRARRMSAGINDDLKGWQRHDDVARFITEVEAMDDD